MKGESREPARIGRVSSGSRVESLDKPLESPTASGRLDSGKSGSPSESEKCLVLFGKVRQLV